MINEQVLAFIRQQLATGATEDAVKQRLAESGWGEEDIRNAFASMSGATLPVPRPSVPAPGSSSVSPAAPLPGAFALLKEAFSMLKSDAKTLLGLSVLIIALSFLWQGIVAAGSSIPGIPAALLFLGGALSIILIALLGLWLSTALVCAVVGNEARLGIKEALGQAKGKMFSLLWLSIITGMLCIGGFVLLVIPAFLFAVWFSLGQFILIAEGDRGLAALLKSREYVRGNLGAVLWRLAAVFLFYLAIFILSGIVVGVISLFVQSSVVMGIVTGVGAAAIAVLISPLITMYFFLVYRHLRASKGVVSVTISGGRRALYVLVAILGIFALLVVPIVIGGALALTSLSGARSAVSDAKRLSDLHFIQFGLLQYASEHNGAYPATLDALAPKDMPSVPADPATSRPYEYQPTPDGQSYRLCATLTDSKQTCISSSSSDASAAATR